jgi:hypothetical protein
VSSIAGRCNLPVARLHCTCHWCACIVEY